MHKVEVRKNNELERYCSIYCEGGGSESEQYYGLWKCLHRHLEKNIILQDSFMKLMEGSRLLREKDLKRNCYLACTDQCERDRWLAKLDNSNWLYHVKEALTTACIVAQLIDCEGRDHISKNKVVFVALIDLIESSVLVHGSDGWDTSLLVTSLTQILLDPNCRTITG